MDGQANDRHAKDLVLDVVAAAPSKDVILPSSGRGVPAVGVED